MNQLAVALKSIPRCTICHEILTATEVSLRVSAHLDCQWMDALTSPSQPSTLPVEKPIRMRQVSK